MGSISKTHKCDDCGNVVMISNSDYSVHNERAYTISDYASGTNSTDGVQWYIHTGSKELHMNFVVAVNGASRIYFHKDITFTTTNAGSVVTSYNLNTSSSNALSTVIYGSGTVTTSGTIMRHTYTPDLATGLGAGRTQGDTHYVLVADSKHMIKAKCLSGTANVCLNMFLSERQ